MSTGTIKLVSISALALALVACSGGPADEATDGYGTGLTDSPPLATLSNAQWSGATEGCEGHLHGTEVFGITQSDALVVANRGGVSVCIDTLEAVSLELEALGAFDAADELYSGFYAAIHLSQVEDWASPTSATLDGGGTAEGDPNPQPNTPGFMNPVEGDPNPQPNLPDDVEENLGTPTPTTVAPPVEANPSQVQADAPATPIIGIDGEELPAY